VAAVLLALAAHVERTYTYERAAHARAEAAAHGRQVGRPSLLDPPVLADAAHLRDAGPELGLDGDDVESADRIQHLLQDRSSSSHLGVG